MPPAHEGRDAILLASQLVTVLQSVASREVNTLDSVVLTRRDADPGGSRTGTCCRRRPSWRGRCAPSSEVQQRVKAGQRIAAGFASAFGAQIDTSSGTPARRPGPTTPAGPTSPARWQPGRVSHPPCRSASRRRRFCGLSSAYSRGVRRHRQRQRYGLHHRHLIG